MKQNKEKIIKIKQSLESIRKLYEKDEIFIIDFDTLLHNKKPQKVISIHQNTWQKNKSFMINPPFEPKEALVNGEIYIETILYLFALWAYEYLVGEPYAMDLSKVKYPGLFQFFRNLLIDDFRKRSSNFDELELYLSIAIEDIEVKHFKRLKNSHFTIEGNTTVGMLRYENQDSFDFDIDNDNAIVIVADGMGGGSAGDVASRIAVNTMMQRRSKLWKTPSNEIDHCLKEIFMDINQSIIRYKQNQHFKSMGTTLSVLLIKEKQLFFAHVGDSRIYIKHKDLDTYKQITLDHSLAEVKYREGKITKEQKRDVAKNILAYVLGSDSLQKEHINTTKDYQDTLKWEDIEGAILCSDGCWDIVGEEYFQEHLDTIFTIGAKHIMQDNMTVVKVAKTHKSSSSNDNFLVKLIPDTDKTKENGPIKDWLIYIFVMILFLGVMTIPIIFSKPPKTIQYQQEVAKRGESNVVPKVW